MLILTYFATVGAVLIAALFALNAYLDPSSSDAGARMPRATTTSQSLVAPETPAKIVIDPDAVPPAVTVTSAAPSAHSTRHRHHVR
jgi:hypothetical protein